MVCPVQSLSLQFGYLLSCNGPSFSIPKSGHGITNGGKEFYKTTNGMDADGWTKALHKGILALRH